MFPFIFFVISSNTVTVPTITDTNAFDDPTAPNSPVFLENYQKKINSECECGKRNTDSAAEKKLGRVIGGNDTLPYEFPWLVYIRSTDLDNTTLPCGASLINDRFVLTAAHCVTTHGRYASLLAPKPAKGVIAVFHTYEPVKELSQPKGTQNHIVMKIIKVIVHPGYIDLNKKYPDIIANDVALLVLEHPVDLTDPVFNPVCLVEKGDEALFSPGKFATLIGWGNVDWKTPQTPTSKSQKLVVPIRNGEDCLKLSPGHDMRRWICAEEGDFKSGANFGDSGGPVFIELKSKQSLQVGSVSHGNELNEAYNNGSPYSKLAFYANILHARPWIDFYSSAYDVKWCKRK